MRVFLDTNIILSGYYFKGNERKILQKVIDRDVECVTCPALLDEIRRIMVVKFKEDSERV